MSQERGETKRWQKEGVIFVVEQDGLILVEKRPDTDRNYGGYTIVPGGKVEPGENAVQALFRETREELGIQASGYSYEPLEKIRFFAPDGHLSVCDTYLVRVFEGSISNCEPEKGEHIWLKPEEALRSCELAASKYVITLALKRLNEAKSNRG